MKKILNPVMAVLLLMPCIKVWAQPANDNFVNATNITSLINTAGTTGGTYTTLSATADQSKASCWSNGPNNNVWFKFTASATGFINAQVKVNGTGETIQNPFVAIYDASLTQLTCQNYQGAKVNLNVSYLGMIPGNTYYIVVDNYSGYAGSFDLVFSDAVNYDFKSGALDVTSLINSSCSTGGTYTTQFASPDQTKATCWSNGPNNNVWFKFTATSTGFINAKVKVSGAGETMQNPFVAIFDVGGTQLACQNFQGAKVDVSLNYLGLTPGNTYYIVVDNYSGYAGSFDLCVSDVVNYDYMAGAVDVTAAINSSCTSGGTYSTQFASPDQTKATCWSNGPNNNVWFKFTATSTGFINAKVNVSGTGETIQNPFVAIFDAAGTQLACQNYQGAKTNLNLSYLGLTPGNTYYIVVDNYSGYAGSFDLCVSDVINYDYKAGAVDVTSLINSTCTTGGTYTTQFATPDQTKATCWSNGPNNNVWFKFTATATGFINAKVKVSGAGETMQDPFVAIFDATGTQVACQNYQGAKVDLNLSYLGLTPGNTYYIAVDNYSGYAGSFDICVSDVINYDYKAGAVDVTAAINNSCTSGGTYTTQFATPDQSKGTCWSNGPNNNVWFQFTATSTGFINAKVNVSGTGETMQNPFVAVFDAAGTQLACQNYQGAKTNLSLNYLGLTPGNTYYIAVDNYSGYAGSFDLCVSDIINYDYKAGAVDVTSAIDNSCTTGGAYSTQFASPDQSKGTCWSNGPNNNVWFKFTATATGFIDAKVNVSGTGETMQNPFVAIFDAGGTQLACQNSQGAKTNLNLSYLGLTPGNTYYIAVDNYSGYFGSFDLCVSDVINYDYKAGAVDVTSAIDNSCTTGGTYTTQFAGPDQSKATCWSNGPNNNVWFQFTATSTGFINAKVNVSGTGETMQNPFVAIFDASGTQLACQNYQGAKTNLSLSYYGLTPGSTYYIAVDNYIGYAGSFDLCLSDVLDYDFKQGAKNANSQLNTTTTGGTYSTQFATPDQTKASCWSNGPNNNVWFQFTATPTAALMVNVIVNGTGETMQNPFVAIYSASGAQLACQNYQGAKTNVSAQVTGLIPGNVYYIAVDNYGGYAGSFDLGVFDNFVTLPLQLSSLTATVDKDRVDVKWTTSHQAPGEIFTVERSKDGMVFEGIGDVTAMGDGASQEQYGMTDYTPLTGTSFYRLKTTDADSNYSYSKTVAVTIGAGTGMQFSLYPNPTVTNSTIVLKVGGVTNTTGILIGIYDLQGRRVYLKAAPIPDAGLHSVELSLGGSFVPGIYQVLVTEPGGKQALYQQKLIVL